MNEELFSSLKEVWTFSLSVFFLSVYGLVLSFFLSFFEFFLASRLYVWMDGVGGLQGSKFKRPLGFKFYFRPLGFPY